MADEEQVEQRVVTAVGVSVNTPHGDEINARLSKAMSDAVLQCNQEGISTSEENSAIIRDRMRAAYEQELAAIQAGN